MPRAKTGMIKFNLYIQPEILKGMKYIAKQRGTNCSNLIRDASREYVVNELKKERMISEEVDFDHAIASVDS